MTTQRRDVWLGLHTTESVGAVAVARGPEVRSRSLPSAGQHAASLLGVVSEELAALDADASRLQGIAVTRGPGSFTGIRIGLATAQGLAFAGALPVTVCDSLEAETLAHKPCGWLSVVLDARRGEVYAALFRTTEQGPEVVLPPFVDSPQSTAQRLLEAAPEADRLVLTGSGASLVADTRQDERLRTVEPSSPEVVARALVDAAAAARLPSMSPRELQPLYLRKSDAEINRQAGFGAR